MKRKTATRPARVCRLKLELKDVEPRVWRELEVLSGTRLTRLHRAIQIAMGWEDYHLWSFQMGERRFERPGEELSDLGEPPEDAGEVSVETLLPEPGTRIVYNYDFGDDWLIVVTLVETAAPTTGVRYPRCIAGERAGPLEDSGGPPGYERLLAARKKPKSREAKELLQWAGEGWDPDRFDLEVVNKQLARLPAPRRVD
jgi:hypothetical protein